MTRSRQVVAGQADLVQFVGEPAALGQFAAEHPGQVHYEDQQATVFVFLNTRRPPFDDVRVRRALNYAVDRQRVAELYGAALARPTCQIVAADHHRLPAVLPLHRSTPTPTASGAAPTWPRAQSLVDASGTKGERRACGRSPTLRRRPTTSPTSLNAARLPRQRPRDRRRDRLLRLP